MCLLAAVWGAPGIVNPGGWPQLRDFFVAAARPETGPDFLRLVWDATLTTVAYAVLGTALAMVLGLIGGILLAETWWRRSPDPSARPGPGHTGRIDAELIAETGLTSGTAFVCGSHAFVETAAALVVAAGFDPAAVRTERFGPTS